jgi:hypothetical protein
MCTRVWRSVLENERVEPVVNGRQRSGAAGSKQPPFEECGSDLTQQKMSLCFVSLLILRCRSRHKHVPRNGDACGTAALWTARPSSTSNRPPRGAAAPGKALYTTIKGCWLTKTTRREGGIPHSNVHRWASKRVGTIEKTCGRMQDPHQQHCIFSIFSNQISICIFSAGNRFSVPLHSFRGRMLAFRSTWTP